MFDGIKDNTSTIKCISGWLPYKAMHSSDNGFCMFWEAEVVKSVLDKWTVKDYYHYMDSDGNEYFNYLLPDDRTVENGVLRGLQQFAKILIKLIKF